ncbi:Major facilitator superfamily domain general substrate transporter [Penicillium malachiteum]|uniref:Major facilitator superfamily domain general substrate transporter n=1 Tax=Penicillium malachiteum TaxID=1324776 RepID=A0AAD6MT45_9EURO|nr:Major facilitator superfamily domain general substrate transporter [Penicillium malachiteum]
MQNIVDCLTFAGDIGVNFLPQPADVVLPVIKGAMQSALEDMYLACLKLICVALKNLQRPTASRVFRALWDPQEVQSQVSELEQAYSTLIGVTENCQSEIIDRIDDWIFDFVKKFNDFESYVANNFHMVLERLDEQRITRTLNWISPVKERDRHDPTNTDRLPDTCEWLLQNLVFKEWDADEEKATLWLQGTLGTGKTYLTSKVIDHLLKTTQPWEGLAYYYCKRTEGRGDEKPEDVIRSLFRQVAAPPADQNSKISKNVQTLFLERNDKASSPEINICKEQILKLINEYSRTTIVLDALDDFPVRKANKSIFLCSSRRDTRKRFADYPTIKTGITDVNDDIRLLIEERVTDIQYWDDMSQEDQEGVVEKLLEKGAGMFQLVKLQIPYLMDCGLKQDVFAQLEKMPKDLTKAYEEIYHKLSQNLNQKKLADRAFMWVMCAYEPLTTDLILAAIRLDGEKDELEEKITKRTLMGLCSNLVVCDAHRGNNIWLFSHASVVEFIEKNLWDLNMAHCHAAKVCLQFLICVYGESMSIKYPPFIPRFKCLRNAPIET